IGTAGDISSPRPPKPCAASSLRKLAASNGSATAAAGSDSTWIASTRRTRKGATISWPWMKPWNDSPGRMRWSRNLNVAQGALETGNVARARELLERQRPERGAEDLRGFEWRYLWRLGREDSLHTFGGHTEGITAATLSPAGKMLASASFDGSVRLWDVA